LLLALDLYYQKLAYFIDTLFPSRSRSMVRARPLSVWKQLQNIMTVQDVCHVGPPDYDNLYSFNQSQRSEVGPEPPEFKKGRSAVGRFAFRLVLLVVWYLYDLRVQ
jgi:hypothetical protein